MYTILCTLPKTGDGSTGMGINVAIILDDMGSIVGESDNLTDRDKDNVQAENAKK